jgi:hypothetical protein
MSKHRNPRPRLSKRPSPDNFDPGVLIQRLYDDLVEVEALAITADECVTALPSFPSGKYKRTLARLYVLVGKTAGRASVALERGEELVLLEARGIRVFSLTEPCFELNAFSHWVAVTPFVFLNTMKTAESSRFDAAHELGHLVLHRHGAPQGRVAGERTRPGFLSANDGDEPAMLLAPARCDPQRVTSAR